jgi:hypothetical protein
MTGVAVIDFAISGLSSGVSLLGAIIGDVEEDLRGFFSTGNQIGEKWKEAERELGLRGPAEERWEKFYTAQAAAIAKLRKVFDIQGEGTAFDKMFDPEGLARRVQAAADKLKYKGFGERMASMFGADPSLALPAMLVLGAPPLPGLPPVRRPLIGRNIPDMDEWLRKQAEPAARQDEFAKRYGAQASGVITASISDAVTTGLLIDAILEASIQKPIKEAFEGIFSSLATAAASNAGT